MKEEQQGKPKFIVEGETKVLKVYENRHALAPKGFVGKYLLHTFQGEKEILFSLISAIQLKKGSSLVNGVMEFTLPGGNETNGGMLLAGFNENAFIFRKKSNDIMFEIKEFIYNQKEKSNVVKIDSNNHSVADELKKLHELKTEGIITEEEFESEKKKILAA